MSFSSSCRICIYGVPTVPNVPRGRARCARSGRLDVGDHRTPGARPVAQMGRRRGGRNFPLGFIATVVARGYYRWLWFLFRMRSTLWRTAAPGHGLHSGESWLGLEKLHPRLNRGKQRRIRRLLRRSVWRNRPSPHLHPPHHRRALPASRTRFHLETR